MVFVFSGFVLMFTNFNTPPQLLNEVIATENIDECYDTTMETWFVEFNDFQDHGATMSDADKKASKLALASYSECEE